MNLRRSECKHAFMSIRVVLSVSLSLLNITFPHPRTPEAPWEALWAVMSFCILDLLSKDLAVPATMFKRALRGQAFSVPPDHLMISADSPEAASSPPVTREAGRI